MKVLIQLSGGKDSQAAAIWTVKYSGFRKEDMVAITCETWWEHAWTYDHIRYIAAELDLPLVVLRSKKYSSFSDMAKSKKRFPSRKAQFCTEELKIKPTVDYILDEVKDDFVMVRGIRREEGDAQSSRKTACMHSTYFVDYKRRYDYSGLTEKEIKKKKKRGWYRYDEAKAFWENYADELLQPLVEWTTGEVFRFILDHGQKPNPLYKLGFSRVGCFPCINCNHDELFLIATQHPDYRQRLIDIEKEVGRSFFAPGYIPARYSSNVVSENQTRVPWAEDALRYVVMTRGQEKAFPEQKKENKNCELYGVCE